MKKIPSTFLGVALLLASGGACTSMEETTTDDALGEVEAAIESPPTGVQCIRLTAVGATTKRKVFAVGTETLSWRLDPGEYALSGEAFDVPCPATGNNVSGDATWLADPVDVEVHEGSHEKAKLHFYKLGTTDTGVDFQPTVNQLVQGGYATYAVLDDGRLFFWGELGRSFATWEPLRSSPRPAQLEGFTNVQSVAAGAFHVCALDTAGEVYCAGRNSAWWPVGLLGVGENAPDTLLPVHVQLPLPAVAIAAGGWHTCALLQDSSVACWGDNSYSQIHESGAFYPTPTQTSMGPAEQVATASYGTCAVRSGAFTCQGLAAQPMAVGAVARLVTGFNHWCAQRANGTVFCSGGAPGATYEAGEVPLLSGSTSLQLGYDHGCATSGAEVSCWSAGQNTANHGQLGDGSGSTGTAAQSGVIVPGLTDVKQLALSPLGSTTCALRENSEIYCWGQNDAGQVGDGTKFDRFVPQRVLF